MIPLLTFWVGVIVGTVIVAFLTSRAYDRGYRDGQEEQIAQSWREYARDRTEVMRKLDLNSTYGKGAK